MNYNQREMMMGVQPPPTDIPPGGTVVYPEPFICVSLLGCHFPAMLDTGSTYSILGNSVIGILKFRRVPTMPCTLSLRFAGGQSSTAVEQVAIDLTWHDGRQIRVNFLLLPTLDCPIILGQNFIHDSDVIINIRMGGWSLGENPYKVFQFEPQCSHFPRQGIQIQNDGLRRTNGSPGINARVNHQQQQHPSASATAPVKRRVTWTPENIQNWMDTESPATILQDPLAEGTNKSSQKTRRQPSVTGRQEQFEVQRSTVESSFPPSANSRRTLETPESYKSSKKRVDLPNSGNGGQNNSAESSRIILRAQRRNRMPPNSSQPRITGQQRDMSHEEIALTLNDVHTGLVALKALDRFSEKYPTTQSTFVCHIGNIYETLEEIQKNCIFGESRFGEPDLVVKKEEPDSETQGIGIDGNLNNQRFGPFQEVNLEIDGDSFVEDCELITGN